MPTNAKEAAEALAALQTSRARLALAADCPPGRHFAFAAILSGLVALPAFPFVVAIGGEVILLCAIALVVRSDRRRTGMFINGYRRGQTLPIALGLLAFYLMLDFLGVWLGREMKLWWAPLVLAVLALPLGYGASVRWQRTFRRELGVDA